MTADLWSKTSWTKDEVDEMIHSRYGVKPNDCPKCGAYFIVKTDSVYLTLDFHYIVDPVSDEVTMAACGK